jgi:ribosome modulation factor
MSDEPMTEEQLKHFNRGQKAFKRAIDPKSRCFFCGRYPETTSGEDAASAVVFSTLDEKRHWIKGWNNALRNHINS